MRQTRLQPCDLGPGSSVISSPISSGGVAAAQPVRGALAQALGGQCAVATPARRTAIRLASRGRLGTCAPVGSRVTSAARLADRHSRPAFRLLENVLASSLEGARSSVPLPSGDSYR